MKLAVLVSYFFLSPALVGQTYSLESLTNNASRYVAREEIQRAMVRLEEDRLSQCGDQTALTKRQIHTYFSAIKIRLSKSQNKRAYLVFPSRYCNAFFGAHAISFWILVQGEDRTFVVVYKGFSDALSLLPSQTNGLRDLDLYYGASSTRARFNGVQYEASKD